MPHSHKATQPFISRLMSLICLSIIQQQHSHRATWPQNYMSTFGFQEPKLGVAPPRISGNPSRVSRNPSLGLQIWGLSDSTEKQKSICDEIINDFLSKHVLFSIVPLLEINRALLFPKSNLCGSWHPLQAWTPWQRSQGLQQGFTQPVMCYSEFWTHRGNCGICLYSLALLLHIQILIN